MSENRHLSGDRKLSAARMVGLRNLLVHQRRTEDVLDHDRYALCISHADFHALTTYDVRVPQIGATFYRLFALRNRPIYTEACNDIGDHFCR